MIIHDYNNGDNSKVINHDDEENDGMGIKRDYGKYVW